MIKEEIIQINKKGYIYKEKQNPERLPNISKLKIFILDEEIYIKEYMEINKKKIENIVNKELKEEFNTSNYLIDFKIDKSNKKTYIYAIKGGDKIIKLLDNVRSINIMPIQFEIMNLLKKKIKSKSFKALINVYENYYLIEVENGVLINNKIISLRDDTYKTKGLFIGELRYPFNNKNLIIEGN